jgi:hypothetical protein
MKSPKIPNLANLQEYFIYGLFSLDTSTSWPSSSGLRGRRRTYLTILKRAWSANSKMVRKDLLLPLRPELDVQDVEASSREDTSLSSRWTGQFYTKYSVEWECRILYFVFCDSTCSNTTLNFSKWFITKRVETLWKLERCQFEKVL